MKKSISILGVAALATMVMVGSAQAEEKWVPITSLMAQSAPAPVVQTPPTATPPQTVAVQQAKANWDVPIEGGFHYEHNDRSGSESDSWTASIAYTPFQVGTGNGNATLNMGAYAKHSEYDGSGNGYDTQVETRTVGPAFKYVNPGAGYDVTTQLGFGDTDVVSTDQATGAVTTQAEDVVEVSVGMSHYGRRAAGHKMLPEVRAGVWYHDASDAEVSSGNVYDNTAYGINVGADIMDYQLGAETTLTPAVKAGWGHEQGAGDNYGNLGAEAALRFQDERVVYIGTSVFDTREGGDLFESMSAGVDFAGAARVVKAATMSTPSETQLQ